MRMTFALKLFITLAALWHTLAFAAGGVFVTLAFGALCGLKYERWWTRVIRTADQQLWISGVALIGLGILGSGFQNYVSNPKLWAKILVIAVWAISIQLLRRYKRRGETEKLLLACGVSLGCWTYGAFLGVAKPLAYGAAPFWAFAAGFVLVCLAAVLTAGAVYRRFALAAPITVAVFGPKHGPSCPQGPH
jgi:hypothetical protein